jgi:hypothetical protein
MASSSSATKLTEVDAQSVHRMNFLEIFGLEAEAIIAAGHLDAAGAAQVKRTYRRLSLRFHPDKDPTPAAREAFERLKLAADTLTNADACREYVQTFRKAAAEQAVSANRFSDAERHASELRRRQELYRFEQDQQRAAEEKLWATRGEGGDGSRVTQAEDVAAMWWSMMSSLRQIELDMVADWEVGAEELAAKERDVKRMLAKAAADAAASRGTSALDAAKRLRARLLAGLGDDTTQPHLPQPAPRMR